MVEFSIQAAFNNMLEIAGDQKTVDGVISILGMAQTFRRQSGNIGCDGDLLYDEDAKVHCANVVQAILDALEEV